jgi:membrane protease YdiL (CAAX protease family)
VTGIKPYNNTRNGRLPRNIRDVCFSFAGILLFAGFIHQPFPLVLVAIGGLAGTGAVIGLSAAATPLPVLFGLEGIDQKVLYYALPALALGILLGILTRNRFDLTRFPEGFTGIALLAPLIGAAEELLFRGYLQGQLRSSWKIGSIPGASAIHTCYKLLVILTLVDALQFDYFFLLLWTFIGGILFGVLRELSGSSIPPVIAHAAFDVLVYGGMAAAPVWVWS